MSDNNQIILLPSEIFVFTVGDKKCPTQPGNVTFYTGCLGGRHSGGSSSYSYPISGDQDWISTASGIYYILYAKHRKTQQRSHFCVCAEAARFPVYKPQVIERFVCSIRPQLKLLTQHNKGNLLPIY